MLRNRSKMPFEMSVLRLKPVPMLAKITVCAITPGRTNCRYSCRFMPAIAPPKRNTKSVTKMIGCRVTSRSCSGLRWIRFKVRQARVRPCRIARTGPMWAFGAARRAAGGALGVIVVVISSPRRRARSAP
jgi:hypothetical protein